MVETESRPAWWRIALGVWVGLAAGALIGGWLVDASFYLTDQLTRREGGPEGFNSIRWYDFPLMYLLWAAIFALMQFLSAVISRWSRTVWIAAGAQTVAMLVLVWVGGFGFVPGVLLPWVIAYALVRTSWLPSRIKRDAARRAARFPTASN